MAEVIDSVDLFAAEVPLCYGVLARFGNMVVGADCLPEKLARFGCRADCDSCVVAEVLNSGSDTISGAVDVVATNIIKAVQTLQAAGKSMIG